jgi:hypothetical protein
MVSIMNFIMLLLKTDRNAHLGNGLKVPDWLHLVDHTGGLGLTVGATLGDWAFATTSTHGDTVDDITWSTIIH